MKVNKVRKGILIAIISAVIIIIIIIMAFIRNLDKKNDNSNYQSDSSQEEVEDSENENEDEELTKKLKNVSESERIRTYLGRYFKYIESKDYEKAYELLYPDFKQKYFPNMEDYQNYIQQQAFPDMLAIEYDKITMQGEYYIVTVTISDLVSKTESMQKEQQFVVKENNYNDYFISFKK